MSDESNMDNVLSEIADFFTHSFSDPNTTTYIEQDKLNTTTTNRNEQDCSEIILESIRQHKIMLSNLYNTPMYEIDFTGTNGTQITYQNKTQVICDKKLKKQQLITSNSRLTDTSLFPKYTNMPENIKGGALTIKHNNVQVTHPILLKTFFDSGLEGNLEKMRNVEFDMTQKGHAPARAACHVMKVLKIISNMHNIPLSQLLWECGSMESYKCQAVLTKGNNEVQCGSTCVAGEFFCSNHRKYHKPSEGMEKFKKRRLTENKTVAV